jgi:hypothetical protein
VHVATPRDRETGCTNRSPAPPLQSRCLVSKKCPPREFNDISLTTIGRGAIPRDAFFLEDVTRPNGPDGSKLGEPERVS